MLDTRMGELPADCVSLILEDVYLSDVYYYSLLGKEFVARRREKFKAGVKLIRRYCKVEDVSDLDEQDVERGWHAAMKHAVTVRDYEMLEVLVANMSRIMRQNFCGSSSTWMCRWSVFRYVVLWRDAHAIEIMHRYRLTDIKLAILRHGNMELVRTWLLRDIEKFNKDMILRHIFDSMRMRVIEYVMASELVSTVQCDSQWYISLVMHNAIEWGRVSFLKTILDTFVACGVELVIIGSNKRRLYHRLESTELNRDIKEKLETQIDRVCYL